ncbi:MAG: serine O-acetyltransferase [Planctomycetota bacterium]|jgi:serine O-acetyltransferase
MITSKKDYQDYLAADAVALGLQGRSPWRTPRTIWAFQRSLRRVEYLQNTGVSKTPWGKIGYLVAYWRFRRLSYKLGFLIAPNVFGPGLAIVHRGTIVVNANTRIGANCRIHVCVNIGASGGSPKAPRIGNNVYIAPGAKIFGDIEIADGIAIGANAVVNKSFSEPNITIGGIPAKKISDKGTEHATTQTDQ